jgi:hypothetical protein
MYYPQHYKKEITATKGTENLNETGLFSPKKKT